MPKAKKATAQQKVAIKARFAAMGAAAAGTPDKEKHTRALAEDATFAEKFELIREALKEEPDLDHSAVCGIAEEYYNEQTDDREEKRKANWEVADTDPREDPVLVTRESNPRKKAKGWSGPAVPDFPTNIGNTPKGDE